MDVHPFYQQSEDTRYTRRIVGLGLHAWAWELCRKTTDRVQKIRHLQHMARRRRELNGTAD